MTSATFVDESSSDNIDPAVTDWLATRRPMLIGDQEVDSAETLAVENPATGLRLAQVTQAGPEHVERAVASARRTFDAGDWRWLPASSRSRLILAAAAAVERHAEELAQLDTLDAGVPISYSRAAITASLDTMEYAAGIPARLAGETLSPSTLRGDQYRSATLRESLGVVGIVVPWNLPCNMSIEKVIVALATGNTVVLKPAEQTPLSALRLAEIFLEAGFPPGAFNVVPGLGSVAGEALVQDARVDKISFTGSTTTGKHIVAAAATNLTPVSLELGGKSPSIVFADADLDAAARTTASNNFLLTGQFCTSPTRALVERSAFDTFVAGLCREAAGLAVGAPLDPTTAAGPLVSAAHRARVIGYVESGIDDGAVAAYRGGAVEGPGYFVRPTVLINTEQSMTIEREEVFGPVISVTPFDTADEAIALANDTHYGLAAGVWTNNVKVAHRMTRDLQAGNVWINCYNVFDPALPFGGYKQSGWGRESGSAAIDLYTQTKTATSALD